MPSTSEIAGLRCEICKIRLADEILVATQQLRPQQVPAPRDDGRTNPSPGSRPSQVPSETMAAHHAACPSVAGFAERRATA
eukprot:1033970-Pleurochrysis_carterae.AAC.1